MRKIFAAVLLALTFAALPTARACFAKPAEIKILRPSALETTIAPGRDFYVIGLINGGWADCAVSVDVYPAGSRSPIRSAHSAKANNYDGINADYAGIGSSTGSDDIRQSGMPDLVYDPSDPDSFNDPKRKCFHALKDGAGWFAAVFTGGANAGAEALAAGEYAIEVTAAGNGETVSDTLNITLADTPDKVSMRFSPADHAESGRKFAAERGWRVYDDPLAGYWWSPFGLPPEIAKEMPSGGLEIPTRYRKAEAIEYSSGTTHVILYNIDERSVTNSVELGALQKSGRIADNTAFYRYDIGEPAIGGAAGKIVRMDAGDRLEPIRLDEAANGDKDNIYDQASLPKIIAGAGKKWNLAERRGESVAIYGVASPIPNAQQDVKENDDGTYTVPLRIKSIRYTARDGNGAALSSDITREVTLTRRYTGENRDRNSIYEYRHVFRPADFGDAERIVLDMVALDTDNNEVDGSADSIEFDFSRPQPRAASGGCLTGGDMTAAALPLLVALCAANRMFMKR